MSNSFRDLSTRTQLLTCAALCVLIAGGAWRVVIGPARARLASRQSRLAELQADAARASIAAGRLPTVQRDLRAMEMSLRRATAELPDEKDAQHVLRNLYELASDSALEVSRFVPKAAAAKPQYFEWPIEVGLSGGFHDLGRFFDRVATMPRLMSVSDLEIKVNPRPTGRNVIVATCLTTTYVFKRDVAAEATGTVALAMTGGAR